MLLNRPKFTTQIETALNRNPIVTLIGPRQSGKTTLARRFVAVDSLNYFDLEDPVSLARLEQPMTALRDLTGLIVIDEVQRRPDLFPVLRVLADRTPLPARFLVLGSAAPALLQQSAESLAGRMEIVSLTGFTLQEVETVNQSRHWRRGGFPRSYLAQQEADSVAWRKNFIQTLLERDFPQLGIGTPSTTLLRFWTMLAHYHGQVLNSAEIARSLSISSTSVRRYLDLLEQVFMLRQLQPWFANLKKRQVKSPKIYFRDSGVLHYLLGIRNEKELLTHPKSGASWEGYVIEEIMRHYAPDEAYFWATHGGAELDLLLLKDGRRLGFEVKRVDAPRLTKSIHIALESLMLDRLTVVYPGNRTYPLAEKVAVKPLTSVVTNSS